jgi:HSP20 family protein
MNANTQRNEARSIVPACSISEDDGLVTVRLEMPGVDRSTLEVKVEGNELEVRGARRGGSVTGRYLLRERKAEAFRKIFTLDDTIAREKIDASLVDGILSLKLAVKEAAKPRKIEVG